MFLGIGGSIPFMPELGTFYPEAEFLVTGVVTDENNIHSKNENLYIPYCRKLLKTIGNVLIDYEWVNNLNNNL